MTDRNIKDHTKDGMCTICGLSKDSKSGKPFCMCNNRSFKHNKAVRSFIFYHGPYI